MRRGALKEGWEVEWCYSLDGEGSGGVDPDTAKYRREDFKSKEEALAFAKKILQHRGTAFLVELAVKLRDLAPRPTCFQVREYDRTFNRGIRMTLKHLFIIFLVTLAIVVAGWLSAVSMIHKAERVQVQRIEQFDVEEATK